MPKSVADAADAFDSRHKTRVSQAQDALGALRDDPTSACKAGAYETCLWEVRWNRFFVPETCAGYLAPERRERPIGKYARN